MNLNFFRGLDKIENLTSDFYNKCWTLMASNWNDHDKGAKPWTNISFGTASVQVASAYAVTASDHVILVNSTSGTVTVTLPTSVGINGRRYTVKDWKGQSATNNITIATTSSQTIDGATTKVVNNNYASYTVASDGANWAII